jgi:preprotein translocase subunit YajC
VVLAAAKSGSGNGLTTILFLLLLFGVVYFLMIRPQQKRRREALQLQSSLNAGDQIVTIGGLHATIVTIDDDVATVEIAPGVVVKFARAAIARTLAKTEETAPDADDEPVAETVADEPVTDGPAVAEPVVEEPVESPVAETRKKD